MFCSLGGGAAARSSLTARMHAGAWPALLKAGVWEAYRFSSAIRKSFLLLVTTAVYLKLEALQRAGRPVTTRLRQ